MKLRTYRCASPRKKGEGIRIGAVRYLPRGVKKEDYARLDYFDVWLPLLSPSRDAISAFKKSTDKESAWRIFKKRYIREMSSSTDAAQGIRLLAEFAAKTPLSIGCYCEDESHCHRSLLKELVLKAG